MRKTFTAPSKSPCKIFAVSLQILWFGLACMLGAHSSYADDAVMPPTSTANEQNSQGTAGSADAPTWYNLHFQGTFTDQGHPGFHSAIPDGPQSMKSHLQTDETTDMTLFMGARIGALELYANPEMDQGFGLSNTLGVAGYTSGEAYKVGEHAPYFQLPRLFGRYVFGLGGEQKAMEDGPNQLAANYDSNNVTLTFGKFSITDMFDNNSYAHDPRADFLNWAIVDMGSFDYAANSWGYTYGGSAEWNQDWWTLRAGLFDMSRQPNDKYLVRGLGQNQGVVEAEERHDLSGHAGKVKALFFITSANMGSYDDAIALANMTSTIPSTSLVRHNQLKPGGGINAEQEIMPDLGAFLRAGMNDGTKEAYDFTEINRSLSGGLSLKGERWGRSDDTVGLGGALNGISKEAQQYFAAGGQGILIGDGQLPSYSGEGIIEAYYKATLVKGIAATADYQCVINPAYDAVRGPINVFAVRLHAEY